MKLLLHACCAPCSVYCVDTLRKEGIEPTMYWFNPNIHPFKEYVARRDCFKDFCEKQNLKCIIEDNYGLDEFCKNVSNDINARCVNYCYPIRMRRVFEFAKENGYDTVSTTLLYSIYQKHDYIKKLCEDLSKEFGIDFLYRDFRVGFEEGHQKAYEMGLYLQKYCGCVFSEEDRYNNPNPPKPELPEGCEYPSRRNVCIKKIENKEEYMELLLDADPSRDSINKYLNDSDVYGLQVEEDKVSIAVISHIDKNTLELKNLATKEEYRGKGYAKRLLKSLCGNYKQKYDKMLVGTSENNIPFYVKQGFDKYEKTIKNYFIDNYDEEIWDGDLQCIDMYYYSKDLKEK
jgi:predicted adenine nucleotide alpha hydrolase (AANH) superfamily ATPase/N-acetylglutamate synthase-like GNAT family acetyltransferase